MQQVTPHPSWRPRAPDAISGTVCTTSRRWKVDRDTVLATRDADSAVRGWWADRADEATLALLRLDGARLLGTSITSQTGRSLRLKPQKFQRLCSISADGLDFPTDPAAFRAAVLQQARGLYGGRPGIRMDIPRLRLALHMAPQPAERDLPDFATRMLQLLQPDALSLPLQAPVPPDEMRVLLQSGSSATALDELPRPLLAHSPAHGLAALCDLLRRAPDPPSRLLLTAIHLPLRKKEPAWLLRNSRPVLLQPYLRRLQATAVFRRQQRRLEALGMVPSEMFAYRRQLAPQQAGLLA